MTGNRRESFAVDAGGATLEVRLPAGAVQILPGSAQTVHVEVTGPDADRLRVEQVGGRVVVEQPWVGVRWARYQVTARTPAGTRLQLQVASADVTVQSALSVLEADTASGDLRAGDVSGDARVRSASGEVVFGSVRGRLEVTTASGSVTVTRSVGEASLRTASGDVRVGRAHARLRVRTASGDVHVEAFEGDDLSCATMSGDVRVGLPAGRMLDVDVQTLSGRIRNDFEVAAAAPASDGHGRLELRTVSGDIRLQRAAPA